MNLIVLAVFTGFFRICCSFRSRNQMQLILVLVSSILWGVTNPFIRKASAGLEKVKASNTLERIFLELKFLFTNPSVSLLARRTSAILKSSKDCLFHLQYLVPFLLNQFGSVFFYAALAYASKWWAGLFLRLRRVNPMKPGCFNRSVTRGSHNELVDSSIHHHYGSFARRASL